MKIYYVRHGEPTYDENDSLTGNGVYQVNEISKYLSQIPFKKAYVSPIRRSHKSADPTVNKLGISYSVLDWASEDFAWFNVNGEYNGKWYWLFVIPTYVEIFKKYINKDNKEFFEDPQIKETKLELVQTTVDKGVDEWIQTLGFVHDRENKKYIAKDVKEKEVIIFAHQGISTFILSSLLDMSFPKFMDNRKLLDCASISIINIDEKTGKSTLEVYNDIKY